MYNIFIQEMQNVKKEFELVRKKPLHPILQVETSDRNDLELELQGYISLETIFEILKCS